MRRHILLLVAIVALAGAGLAWWVISDDPIDPVDCCAEPPDEEAAVAEGPLPDLAGQTILAGCRQGECVWMRIGEVTRVATVPQGELRRMTSRRGSSLHLDGNLPDREADAAIEWEAEERADYAFCSVERPAYAFEEKEDEGGRGLITHYLDLYDLPGYQTVSGRLYLRLCHGAEGEAALETQALGRLGDQPGTRSEQTAGGAPEDMTRF